MAQTYGQKYRQVVELLNSYIKVNYDTKFNKEEQEVVSFFVRRFDTDLGHLRENHILNDKDFYTKGVKRLAQNIVDALIADAPLEQKTK